jgi:hypothetical protein
MAHIGDSESGLTQKDTHNSAVMMLTSDSNAFRMVCLCRGQRREETFENVLRNPLTFPSKPAISSEAQDLISKLLVKDPVQRLGTKVRA